MIWNTLLDPALSGRLCLTLLHSIWQVSLLIGVLWLVERCWQKNNVERHYVLYVTALLFAVLALPVTFALVDQTPTEPVAARPSPVRTEALPSLADMRPAAPIQNSLVISEPLPVKDSLVSEKQTTRSAMDLSPVVSKASPARRSQVWLWLAPWIVACYVAGVALMLFRLQYPRAETRRDSRTDLRRSTRQFITPPCSEVVFESGSRAGLQRTDSRAPRDRYSATDDPAARFCHQWTHH